MPVSTLDRTAADAAAAQARGIRMFSLGITSQVSVPELIALASPPKVKNQNYYEFDNFNQLNQLSENVLTQTCTSMSGELLWAGSIATYAVHSCVSIGFVMAASRFSEVVFSPL